jgi:thioredoxin 1
MRCCNLRRLWRVAAALMAVAALTACSQAAPPLASNNLRLIGDARQSGLPTVVEFGSVSCASCRQMKIVLDAVAVRAHGRGHVLVMDVIKDAGLQQSFRISMIPTQVFFDAEGKETQRHLGPLSEDQVLERLGLGK